MKKSNLPVVLAASAVTLVALILALAVFTVLRGASQGETVGAFGSQMAAGTRLSPNQISASSGSDNVTLQISTQGGADFTPMEEVPINQVNQTNSELLIPVSTSDLNTFFYCKTVYGNEADYEVVEDEEYYYHGQIYIRAVADDTVRGSLALYFDQSAFDPNSNPEGYAGGSISEPVSGTLNNAARLGLTFNGSSSKIFSLSEEHNPSEDQVLNTYLAGNQVAAGSVLAGSAGSVYSVPDPAIPISDATVEFDGDSVILPDTAVTEIQLNTIYTLDVYYYLEGCDPDCSDAVTGSASNLHLSFYGLYLEESVASMTVNVYVNGNSFRFDSYVTDSCTIFAGVYDTSGRMLALTAVERSATQDRIDLNLSVTGLPAQYTIKVFHVNSQFAPLSDVMTMEIK